jgi:hypothetical protein
LFGWLAAAFICGILTYSSPAHAQSTLDPALAFAMLSGGKLTFDHNADVNPSIALPTGATGAVTLDKGAEVGLSDCISLDKVTLKKDAFVDGVCATNGGKVTTKKGASCGGGTNTTPANPSITSLTNFASLGARACRNPAGQDQGALVIDKNGTTTITAMSGFQEFDFSKIMLKASSQLTVSGQSDSQVVLNVSGSLSLAKGAFIIVNGFPINELLVIAKKVTLGKDSELEGTAFSNGTCKLGTDATVDGQLLCAKSATLGVFSNVLGDPLDESIAVDVSCP